MKKFFVIAAAALVALAACTKAEINDADYQKSKEISFTAVNGKNTKAPLESQYYPTDIPFGVFAYALTQGQTWAANSASGQLYMNNETISYSTTEDANGIYAPSTTYYWPLSGSLTFIGYSPKATTGTVAYAPATKALTVTDFTVNATAASQQDLMWATTQADCTDETVADKGNYLSASDDTQSTYKGVNMIFHHALSQVKFNVKKAAGLDDYTITVNSITFDAYSKGTLTVTNDSPAWSAQAKQDAFVYNTNGTDVVAPNNSAEFAAFGVANMPVPQTLAAATQTFTITYSLEKSGVNLGQKTVTMDLLGAQITAWAPNTIYNYNIVIDLKKIYFNPSITDWETGASQVINVPNA
ncbi:MAG: fimbrillin family protein [Bacteroidales bacterium]|nr:fimbrillin family protein [Bacteroidales bacterium]